MKAYRMALKTEEDTELLNVEWSRKPGSPPPTVGQALSGTLDSSGPFGPKFKPEQAAGGFGKPGGGGRDTPETRRSIAMQHAQKCAVTILDVAASHGEYRPPNAGDVAHQVKAVAAILFEQVQQAEGGPA